MNIEVPFELGETVWRASYGNREERVQCPECLGSTVITILRGDGERFDIDCGCCKHSYDATGGTIKRFFSESEPELFTCRRVRIDGDDVEYSESPPGEGAYNITKATRLFRDKADCQKECDRINEETQKENEAREVRNIASKRKGMAWSVHYWNRNLKELERKVEVARARLHVCKEKAKVRVCAADKKAETPNE